VKVIVRVPPWTRRLRRRRAGPNAQSQGWSRPTGTRLTSAAWTRLTPPSPDLRRPRQDAARYKRDADRDAGPPEIRSQSGPEPVRPIALPNHVIAAQMGWSESAVDKMVATYAHAEIGALDAIDAAFATVPNANPAHAQDPAPR
jgi:hypothetical protein